LCRDPNFANAFRAFFALIASSCVLLLLLGHLCFADRPMKASIIAAGIVVVLAIPARAIENCPKAHVVITGPGAK
jgi:hypothetical protein